MELNTFRQQVDEEIEKANKQSKKEKKINNIQEYIQSVTQHLGNASIVDDDQFEDAIDEPHSTTTDSVVPQADKNVAAALNDDAASISSNDLNEVNDDLVGLDPNSREYRFKMVEKILSDARSMRSYSTSASTIAPSVIKDKMKKTIDLKEKREIRKRCLAKGEANAVTRGRKENSKTVKEYAGWDF